MLPEQLCQRGVVHGLMVELRVQRDRHHLVIEADILAQHGKTDGQRHAVLAAGNAHHHPVAGGNHFIVLYGLAHQTAEPLHCTKVAHDRLTLSTRLTTSLMDASFVSAET